MLVCYFNKGTSNQPNVLTTEKESQGATAGQHPGPMRHPNKDYSSGTHENDKTPSEESAGSSKSDQRPGRAPSASSDHGHEQGVGSKGTGVISTISYSETPAKERAAPTDKEQRPEGSESISPDRDHDKADHGPETPTGKSSRSPKADQNSKCAASNSSQQGHEELTDSRGGTVTSNETTEKQTGLSDTRQNDTFPLEEQAGRITSEDDCGGKVPNESKVPPSSTNYITANEHPAETVRRPAVLEGSEIPNSSVLDNAEQNTMPENSDDRQAAANDQNQQKGKGSATEERNTTKNGENPVPIVGPTTKVSKSQHKAPEKENLLGLSPTLEDNKELDQVSNNPSRNFSFLCRYLV